MTVLPQPNIQQLTQSGFLGQSQVTESSFHELNGLLLNLNPPERQPPPFVGQMPDFLAKELVATEQMLTQLPADSEQYKRLRKSYEELLIEFDSTLSLYDAEHSQFVESGLSASEFAGRKLAEELDPSGWKETFFGNLLDTIWRDVVERRVAVGAETLGLLGFESAGKFGRELRREINREEALQAYYDRERNFVSKWLPDITGQLTRATSAGAVGSLAGGPFGALAGIVIDAGAETFAQSIYEADQAGISGSSKYAYAGINTGLEVAVTLAFMKKAPGLEGLLTQTKSSLMKQLGNVGFNRNTLRAISQEVPEEMLIEFGQAFSAKVTGVDPDALTPENLNRLFWDTLILTTGTVGMASTVRSLGAVFNDNGDVVDAVQEGAQLQANALGIEDPGQIERIGGTITDRDLSQFEGSLLAQFQQEVATAESRDDMARAFESLQVPPSLRDRAREIVREEQAIRREMQEPGARAEPIEGGETRVPPLETPETDIEQVQTRLPPEPLLEETGDTATPTPNDDIPQVIVREPISPADGQRVFLRPRDRQRQGQTVQNPYRPLWRRVYGRNVDENQPDGAAQIALELGAGRQIADMDSAPTRRQFEQLGLPAQSQEFRSNVQQRLRDHFEEIDATRRADEATEFFTHDAVDTSQIPADIAESIDTGGRLDLERQPTPSRVAARQGIPSIVEQGRQPAAEPKPQLQPALRSDRVTEGVIPQEPSDEAMGLLPESMRRLLEGSPENSGLTGDYALTPGVEKRIRRAADPKRKKKGMLARLARLGEIIRDYTRSRPTLPTGLFERPDLAPFRFTLDRIRETNSWAMDETMRSVAWITEPLQNNEQLLAGTKILAISDAREGRLDPENREILNFGYENDQQLEADYQKLHRAMKKDDATIGEFVRRYNQIRKALTEKLVERGFLPTDALERQDYFHREIVARREANRQGNSGITNLQRVKKGFQISRRKDGRVNDDPELDPSADFFEASMGWMADAMESLRKENLKDFLRQRSRSTADELRHQAKVRFDNENRFWDILVERDDIDLYVVEPSSSLHRETAVAEHAIELAKEKFAKQELKVDDFDKLPRKDFWVKGMDKESLILPKEVVAELNRLDKEKPSTPAWRWKNAFVRGAKEWWTQNPMSNIPFQIRNLFGDGEGLFAVAPGAFTELPNVERMMRRFYRPPGTGDRAQPVLNPPELLQAALDHGVTRATFEAAEMDRVRQSPLLTRFEKPPTNPAEAAVWGLRNLRNASNRLTNYRESLMRMAAFSHFRKQLAAGKVRNFGASKKSVIQALQNEFGVDAAAAQMTNDAMLDYNDISLVGNKIRSWLIHPFWSFVELNARRHARILHNNFYTLPKDRFQEAVRSGATPLSAGFQAGQATAIASARQIGLAATIYAYNQLFHRDEWEELAAHQRQGLSIIIGRREDGTILTFNRPSAVGELTEWMGINEAVALWGMMKEGQLSTADWLKEAAIRGPVQNLVNAASIPRLPFELAMNETLFPDVQSPRPVAADDHLAGAFNLLDLYREFKGMVQKDGTRARPGWHWRWLVSISDPERNAYSQTFDLMDRFKEQNDIPNPPAPAVSQWRNFRYSAEAEDFDAFLEVKQRWEDSDRNFRDFRSWVRAQDPFRQLNREREREFVNEFLTDVQRSKVEIARQHALQLQGTLLDWWRLAEQGKRPEVRADATLSGPSF